MNVFEAKIITGIIIRRNMEFSICELALYCIVLGCRSMIKWL